MRIYQPTNEFGQALLNQGQRVATSKAITKKVSDNGTITITPSDITDIADWDVRSVSVVISGEKMAFQPDIKRGVSDSIVITFHKTGESIEGLGEATIVLSLLNSDGLMQELTIEQKIARAIASHDAVQIRAIAAEAKDTGEDRYRFATCESYNELVAAGFDVNSYNGENLMCLVDAHDEELFFEGIFTGLSIASFSTHLPMLSNGTNMFCNCSGLTSFNGDLSALSIGNTMFFSCSNLTSFESALPALTSGYCMFWGCSNLTSFNGDLSSLTEGDYMFDGCKLDQNSVDRILASINDLASQGQSGNLSLGVASGVDKRTTDFAAKGWTID